MCVCVCVCVCVYIHKHTVKVMQNYYLQKTVIAAMDESEFPLYLGLLVSHLYCAHCLTAFLAGAPKTRDMLWCVDTPADAGLC